MSVTKARKRLTEWCLFSFLWNVGSDSAEITSSGREFQISGAATEKARLPTVVEVTGGTKMRLCRRSGVLDDQTHRRRGQVQIRVQTRKPSFKVAPTTIPTLVVNREFPAGSYLFIQFPVQVCFPLYVDRPAHTAKYVLFPISLQL